MQSHCWRNICGSPQCWEYWQTEIPSTLPWEANQGGSRVWEEMRGNVRGRGKANVEAEWRRDCLLSATGSIIIITHTQLGDTGILCSCPAAAGYHYRWCRLFGADTCSSLVTSQRGLFVLATYIPLLIAAHKPHRLLKDLDLIHTAFNTLSEILEKARFGWNIRCSPESRCSFRSNHFHLHCQDFQAF